MKRIGDQRECVHLFLGHRNARRILPGVEFGPDPEPGGCPDVPDAVDDGLVRRQRGAAPVRRDVTEEPVLDLVPLAGAGWKMTRLDGQSGLVGQLLKRMLPGAQPIPVAPARIGRDEQGRGLGVGAATHLMPPVSNRRHRERRCVVVPAHAHPGFVARHVADAVRNRLALGVGREIMHQHRRRRALRLPFAPAVLEVPDQLFLLRVDRDHRLAGGQMLVRGLVDVLELRVAVRMRGAFLPLARRLQPVAQAVQQPAHSGRTHPPPLLVQRRRQLRATLARPAQRRGRVSARQRIHQGFERGLDAGLILLDARPSASRASDAVRRRLVAGNLPASLANRLPSQTGGRRNHRAAAVADSARLGRRPPAATALVQHGLDGGILRNKGRFQLDVSLHTSSMTRKSADDKLV